MFLPRPLIPTYYFYKLLLFPTSQLSSCVRFCLCISDAFTQTMWRVPYTSNSLKVSDEEKCFNFPICVIVVSNYCKYLTDHCLTQYFQIVYCFLKEKSKTMNIKS